jgi:hypothetical protein
LYSGKYAVTATVKPFLPNSKPEYEHMVKTMLRSFVGNLDVKKAEKDVFQ